LIVNVPGSTVVSPWYVQPSSVNVMRGSLLSPPHALNAVTKATATTAAGA
jgi:hypothetical protein